MEEMECVTAVTAIWAIELIDDFQDRDYGARETHSNVFSGGLA